MMRQLVLALLTCIRQAVRCVILKLISEDSLAVHASVFRVLGLVAV
jgi:hypothetical protein